MKKKTQKWRQLWPTSKKKTIALFDQVEYEKMLAEFLDDLSSVIRDITAAASAHDSFLSPGRLSTTASQDYFLFIGRLSSTVNGITALEKAGIFQESD